MRSAALSLSFSVMLVAAPDARANPGVCPGSEAGGAVYDPGTGLPPELASPPWTLTGTDGSLVEVVPADGVAVLRITDEDMPAGGGECAPGAGADETTAWALPMPELGAASVYGIEAQVRVPFECTDPVTGEGSGKALFGLVDGDVIVVAVVGGPGHPGVAFFDVLADAPLGEPVFFDPGFTTALHAYTLRCTRGLRCDVFVDGGAAPVLQAAYAAMTPLSALPPGFPLAPYAEGVFAFGSQAALSEWARVEVDLCEGDALAIATAAVQETASLVSTVFAPKPATQVNQQLTGPGGATVKFAQANVFLGQDQVCDAVGKIDGAREKVGNATTKTNAFPTCPGGATCVENAARTTVLNSLAVDAMLVDEAKISTCTLDPTCAGCPSARLSGSVLVLETDGGSRAGAGTRILLLGRQLASPAQLTTALVRFHATVDADGTYDLVVAPGTYFPVALRGSILRLGSPVQLEDGDDELLDWAMPSGTLQPGFVDPTTDMGSGPFESCAGHADCTPIGAGDTFLLPTCQDHVCSLAAPPGCALCDLASIPLPGLCTPSAEACNGRDDDCDGRVDESPAENASQLAACRICGTTPQVLCGTYLCTAWPAMTRSRETSNAHGACRCTERCEGGAFSTCTPPTPAAEICDGFDNDCDGTIDEGFLPVVEYVDGPPPRGPFCDGPDGDTAQDGRLVCAGPNATTCVEVEGEDARITCTNLDHTDGRLERLCVNVSPDLTPLPVSVLQAGQIVQTFLVGVFHASSGGAAADGTVQRCFDLQGLPLDEESLVFHIDDVDAAGQPRPLDIPIQGGFVECSTPCRVGVCDAVDTDFPCYDAGGSEVSCPGDYSETAQEHAACPGPDEDPDIDETVSQGGCKPEKLGRMIVGDPGVPDGGYLATDVFRAAVHGEVHPGWGCGHHLFGDDDFGFLMCPDEDTEFALSSFNCTNDFSDVLGLVHPEAPFCWIPPSMFTEEGDDVYVVGEWVLDCGHQDYAEIHSIEAFARLPVAERDSPIRAWRVMVRNNRPEESSSFVIPLPLTSLGEWCEGCDLADYEPYAFALNQYVADGTLVIFFTPFVSEPVPDPPVAYLVISTEQQPDCEPVADGAEGGPVCNCRARDADVCQDVCTSGTACVEECVASDDADGGCELPSGSCGEQPLPPYSADAQLDYRGVVIGGWRPVGGCSLAGVAAAGGRSDGAAAAALASLACLLLVRGVRRPRRTRGGRFVTERVRQRAGVTAIASSLWLLVMACSPAKSEPNGQVADGAMDAGRDGTADAGSDGMDGEAECVPAGGPCGDQTCGSDEVCVNVPYCDGPPRPTLTECRSVLESCPTECVTCACVDDDDCACSCRVLPEGSKPHLKCEDGASGCCP